MNKEATINSFRLSNYDILFKCNCHGIEEVDLLSVNFFIIFFFIQNLKNFFS